MRNRILSLLMLVTFGASLSPAAAKIAVVTKVKGMVEMERDKSGFNALKPGIILEDGDRIRTGSNGFTALIYIDDKSLLKIKENTEIVITGKRDVNSISKEANISQGTLRASVGKQKKGEFVVKSPTSVASLGVAIVTYSMRFTDEAGYPPPKTPLVPSEQAPAVSSTQSFKLPKSVALVLGIAIGM